MIAAWLIIPIAFSLLNAVRGAKKISDGFFASALSVVVSSVFLLQSHDVKLSGVMGLSFGAFAFWWNVYGWGRYFTAGHGDFRIWNNESDDPFVDFIVDRIYGRNLTTTRQAVNAGTVAMCIRAWSFYPAFIGAAVYTGNIWVAVIGLGVFTQGLFYRFASQIFSTLDFIRPAERLTGAWFGALIVLAGIIIV